MMLTLLAAFFIGLSSVRAQSNTELATALGNIDFDFWGSGVRPDLYGTPVCSSCCSSCYWTSAGSSGPINAEAFGTNTLSYICTTARTFASSFTNVDCGTGWGGGGTAKSSQKTTLSVLNDSSAACSQMYFSGYLASKSGEWQQAFDSLTHFIETCPNNPHSPSAFSQITTAVARLYGPDGGTYRGTYLEWLESVLYLNTTNPEYFCADVEEMVSTLPLTHDTAAGHESRWTNIGLSLLRWLIQNTPCDSPELAQEYDDSRQTQREQWANDPSAYKLDTTLFALDSIQPGLQELLDRHFLYLDVSERQGPAILSNATASPNPTSTGTIISFGISKEAYVKIEVFDLLGNRVSSAGFESLFEPGNKAVPISLQGLPSGTYFARILTAYGEVQTVKLVKE
ncbi:MAG TPA: T9SS type A sorting domain-containing protein [Candidatus Kapabacteria bacterium]|nr:T9SS type A sorting domain-containing protein [Candidatus Kapabacteria bacterium]